LIDRLLGEHRTVHAPHLVDVEVLSAMRRLRAGGTLSDERAARALRRFADLRLIRHAHVPLRARIWQLSDRLTSYDAAYVALAELLPADLVTSDARLAETAAEFVDVTHAA
jgi:predicted nucleic acid-binding protein